MTRSRKKIVLFQQNADRHEARNSHDLAHDIAYRIGEEHTVLVPKVSYGTHFDVKSFCQIIPVPFKKNDHLNANFELGCRKSAVTIFY